MEKMTKQKQNKLELLAYKTKENIEKIVNDVIMKKIREGTIKDISVTCMSSDKLIDKIEVSIKFPVQELKKEE